MRPTTCNAGVVDERQVWRRRSLCGDVGVLVVIISGSVKSEQKCGTSTDSLSMKRKSGERVACELRVGTT